MSVQPTNVNSRLPTVSPTVPPTVPPTISPTLRATFPPVGSANTPPTRLPTPTLSPTMAQTSQPSSQPTPVIYCDSALNTYCRRKSDPLNKVVPGYSCSNSVCTICPSGTFGIDGITCLKCGPYLSSSEGADKCSNSVSQVVPGLRKFYIPLGIKKIHVQLWGGGGAGDQCGYFPDAFNPAGGGGGGYASCNVSVTPDSNIYVLVAEGAYGTTRIDYVDPGG